MFNPLERIDSFESLVKSFNNKDQELIRKLEYSKTKEQELGVDNLTTGYDGLVFSKQNILSFLLFKQPQINNRTLLDLFKIYFNKVDEVYTIEDINEIIKKHPEIKYPGNKIKVKKDKYIATNKTPYTAYIETFDDKVLVGASNIDRAIWFYFSNEKTDVNNGFIYTRKNSVSGIKLFSTFEVNAYSIGKTVVTDKVTGIAEMKDKITFNPNWLNNTIDNMEKHVFQMVF